MLVVWIKNINEKAYNSGSRRQVIEPLQCCGHFPPSSRRFTAAGCCCCCCQGRFRHIGGVVLKMVWFYVPVVASSSWLWGGRACVSKCGLKKFHVVNGAHYFGKPRDQMVRSRRPNGKTHDVCVILIFIGQSWTPYGVCTNLSSGHVRCGILEINLKIRLTFGYIVDGRSF